MSVLKTIYSVDRTPATAAARNTLGYAATAFEVVADTEAGALEKAKRISAYKSDQFAWRITGSRVVLVEESKPESTDGSER